MPITNGNYTAPAWSNNQAPAINDTELLAISQTLRDCQILKGSGAPTQYTAGTVGQLYVDTTTTPKTIYQCRGAAQDNYVWQMTGNPNANLAENYDATASYSEGDYCIYGGYLYKAKQDIPTAEAWTAAHWERAWLGDDLADHVSDTNNPHEVTKAQAGLGNVDNILQYSASNPAVSVGSISLTTTWTGTESPYTQTVTVSGPTVTANSKIDLQPTAAQINQMITDGVTGLIAENNNGTITVYALAAAPTTAMTMQCTVTETLQSSGNSNTAAKTITANGTYYAADEGLTGYSSVTVAV